jgi:hypothetical protein
VNAADEAALEVVRKVQFDPKRVAIVDTSSRIAAQQIKTLPEPLDIPVRVVSYAPGRIQMQLASPAPGNAALVVSENYFTGWHATADGRPVVVDRADYNLIGVQLPQGARNIDLQYTDPAYLKGRVITFVALIASLLAIIVGALGTARQARQSAVAVTPEPSLATT